MKIRNRKTLETVTVADQDDTHFLTTDDRLIERGQSWYELKYYRLPRFHNLARPNVHMNGCQAAPIQRIY